MNDVLSCRFLGTESHRERLSQEVQRAEAKQPPFCSSYWSFIGRLTYLVWNSGRVCNCPTFPWSLPQLLRGQVCVCRAPWLTAQASAWHPHLGQRWREPTRASACPGGLQPIFALSQLHPPSFRTACSRTWSFRDRNKDNSLTTSAQPASMVLSGWLCVSPRSPASLMETWPIQNTVYAHFEKSNFIFITGKKKTYSYIRGRIMHCRKFGKYLNKEKKEVTHSPTKQWFLSAYLYTLANFWFYQLEFYTFFNTVYAEQLLRSLKFLW